MSICLVIYTIMESDQGSEPNQDEAVISSRGFHVYKETTWSNAKVGNEVKVEVEFNLNSIAHDPYSCAIKARHEYFTGWKIVGHISREISQYFIFFVRQKGERVYGKLKS